MAAAVGLGTWRRLEATAAAGRHRELIEAAIAAGSGSSILPVLEAARDEGGATAHQAGNPAARACRRTCRPDRGARAPRLALIR